MNILEVKDVHKNIGNREIIKGISFNIKEGEIFGFLGPNGAGKTTTIRMLVGMITPTSGSISIAGCNIQKERIKVLSNIGAIVENPELYTYLTGRQNLMQIAAIRKIAKEDVDATIELVGLTEKINDKVKKYSLGMKQRLGLAAALLSKPKLLILDEPTNGLDPTGILSFRKIVKKAVKETKAAVLISSHILSEVQELCDTVAFINDGFIKSIESIDEGSVEINSETIVVVTTETQKCGEILETLKYVENFYREKNTFTIKTKINTTDEIVFALSEKRVPIKKVYKKRKGLEERYMELVERGER